MLVVLLVSDIVGISIIKPIVLNAMHNNNTIPFWFVLLLPSQTNDATENAKAGVNVVHSVR